MAKRWSKEKYNGTRINGIALASELIDNMRAQDKADLIAADNDIVFEVCASLQDTETSYVYRGEAGELLCIMGISGYIPEAAGRCVYMLGTETINDMSYVKQLLVTEARKVVRKWVDAYGLIFNAVNVENEKSIRWLTRLGAVWLPEEIETSKGKFRQFIITKGSVINV